MIPSIGSSNGPISSQTNNSSASYWTKREGFLKKWQSVFWNGFSLRKTIRKFLTSILRTENVPFPVIESALRPLGEKYDCLKSLGLHRKNERYSGIGAERSERKIFFTKLHSSKCSLCPHVARDTVFPLNCVKRNENRSKGEHFVLFWQIALKKIIHAPHQSMNSFNHKMTNCYLYTEYASTSNCLSAGIILRYDHNKAC